MTEVKIALLQWQPLGFLPSLWGSPTYRSAPMNSSLVGIPPLWRPAQVSFPQHLRDPGSYYLKFDVPSSDDLELENCGSMLCLPSKV